MDFNDDVLTGRQKKVRGCARLTVGEKRRDEREAALGRLEYTAGLLQQRRGVFALRMERARARMALPAGG